MPRDLRVSALIGRHAHDRSGKPVGRVTDVQTERDAGGRERVVAVIVTGGPWGRLLGYDRSEQTGPAPLEWLAHRVMRRHVRSLPWDEVTIGDLPH